MFCAVRRSRCDDANSHNHHRNSLTTGPCLKLLYIRMQEAIDTALEWGRQQGLSFSPPKTVAVLFTRRTAPVPPRRLWMGNVEIQLSDQVKYLGLLLDRQLTWSSHINCKIKQAKGLLLKDRKLHGKGVGPVAKMGAMGLHQNCLPSPHLRCAGLGKRVPGAQPAPRQTTPSVYEGNTSEENLNVLIDWHYFSWATSDGVTPTGGLEVISYVMPLDLFMIETVLMALLRTRGTKDWWEWI